MGKINLALTDECETALRKKLGENGFKKGDMAKYIERLIMADINNSKIENKKRKSQNRKQ